MREGEITLSDRPMRTGDAVIIEDHDGITIEAVHPSELILVDLPMQWEPVGVWRR